jgi:hypothetical protein
MKKLFTLLCVHFFCSLLIAILTQIRITPAAYTKTVVAYSSAALWAQVEFHTRIKIYMFKSVVVFICPQQLSDFFMFYCGKIPLVERQGFTLPFFSAAVAEKAERKLFFA